MPEMNTVNTTQTLTRPTRSGGTAPRPERPAVIAGTRPPSDSSAGDMVLVYPRIQAHALRTLEPKVRADESDSVHQMRMATRRLRAACCMSASSIGRSGARPTARGVWKRASRSRYHRWMN